MLRDSINSCQNIETGLCTIIKVIGRILFTLIGNRNHRYSSIKSLNSANALAKRWLSSQEIKTTTNVLNASNANDDSSVEWYP